MTSVKDPITRPAWLVLGLHCVPLEVVFDSEFQARQMACEYAQRHPQIAFMVVRTVCVFHTQRVVEQDLRVA